MNKNLFNSLPPEAQIQIKLVSYIWTQFKKKIVPVHIPNDMARTSSEGYVKKRMGMFTGASDLLIIGKNKNSLFLEVKTESGTLSKEQNTFKSMLENRGHDFAVGYGLEDCIKIVHKYHDLWEGIEPAPEESWQPF